MHRTYYCVHKAGIFVAVRGLAGIFFPLERFFSIQNLAENDGYYEGGQGSLHKGGHPSGRGL